MKEPIISVSGLRGIIGESLSPDVVMRFACAFASGAPRGPIVVTRDGRTTGQMLVAAIHAGLCAVGRDVIAGDVAATPTTGVLVREHQAAGGIQVSASHNPLPYNGLKLFDSQGQVLTANLGQHVCERYRSGESSWVGHEQIGRVQACEDTIGRHLELVLATIDTEQVRSKQFRVLLDSNHGAGSRLGRTLLERLGCQVVSLGETPDGQFSHPPEPTQQNLAPVLEQVRKQNVHVGFCQDPDADRLALIDEGGQYVGEEYTLALCLDHVLRKNSGPVVTNCATSRMAQDLAQKYACPFFRSAVGEANVVATMRAEDAVFGGEGNGGPIDPRVGYVRDSFVGMALILEALAEQDLPLSQLAADLPRYEIQKTKIGIDFDRVATGLSNLETTFSEATADRQDGLRLDWPDRWLLVRASNTEPIVRIIAEATTRELALQLCEQAAKVLQPIEPSC